MILPVINICLAFVLLVLPRLIIQDILKLQYPRLYREMKDSRHPILKGRFFRKYRQILKKQSDRTIRFLRLVNLLALPYLIVSILQFIYSGMHQFAVTGVPPLF